MNYASIIAKKEIRGYITSPAAYIVLVIFLLLGGWFFANPLFLNNQADMRGLFSLIPIIYLFFIPAITMGLLAKERNNGTIELLTTLPIKDSDIIMGKFWASLLLIGIGLLFTLIHVLTIVILGKNIDYGSIFCGYLGLILLGGVYSAIGIFSSSITSNQIVAFIISFFIVFFLFITGIFQYLSVSYHFSNISRGVIDSRNIIYFLSLIFVFLKLSQFALSSRKWK